MNVFRICGDMMHLFAILMLPFMMWRTKSCSGISGKSIILFAIVFTTRYIDLFTVSLSVYNSLMKFVFLSSSYGTLYLIFYTLNTTYDRKYDHVIIFYLIVPALALSFLTSHVYTIMEILWTFSIILESVAIIPQLVMRPRSSKDESIISHYLFALFCYKTLYLLNWYYRYSKEGFYDPIVIVAGTMESMITFTGYLIITTQPKPKIGPIRVVVTYAASQLAYSLIFKIANGEVFGTKQQVILHLIDSSSAMEVLEGVCMEIDDLALPLVKGYEKTTKLEEAFKNVDAAFLLGAMKNSKSKEKIDFLSTNVKTFKSLDVYNASVQTHDSSKSMYDTLKDTKFREDDFIKTIQTRDAAVIHASKKLSVMSTAKAAVDHMHDWWFGTSNGTWVSMGVISDGSYGVPKNIIYSMPVTIYKKQWTIVQGLKITSFAKNKLNLAVKELIHENEEAIQVCHPHCVVHMTDRKT